MQPTADEMDERKVIGFDFGTTFSGIAYAFANERSPKVVAIMDWPGNKIMTTSAVYF